MERLVEVGLATILLSSLVYRQKSAVPTLILGHFWVSHSLPLFLTMIKCHT